MQGAGSARELCRCAALHPGAGSRRRGFLRDFDDLISGWRGIVLLVNHIIRLDEFVHFYFSANYNYKLKWLTLYEICFIFSESGD